MPDVKATIARVRQQGWVAHVIRAAVRFQSQRGDYYAAGITYFTVLALFPLLMVGFAVAGFVLAENQELLTEAQNKITESMPGSMGEQINSLIDQAIGSRTSVGVIGLLAALYAGIGWITNLRAALTEQWEQQHEPANFLVTKVRDLGALAGLVVAILMSFGVSAIGTGTLAERGLELVELDGSTVAAVVLKVVSILVSVVASWAVFVWVIARMPREPVTLRSAARAALIAAVAFEIFKQVGVIYLNVVLSSPAGVAFGPIIGIMVFAYFTARIVLFATAWAATATENLAMAYIEPPEPAVISPRLEVHTGPTVAGSVALVGAGALAALGLSGLRRRR
ncbi:MAG TPA: inner membrane protein YhjD [Aldersonia sp.]